MPHRHFLAEWNQQSAIQLTWPHEETDWVDNLNEVLPCFVTIAREILKRQHLLVVCANKETLLQQLGTVERERLHVFELPSNDTWARDHGAFSVFIDDQPTLLDFTFNGWGNKFPADKDNRLTQHLVEGDAFLPGVRYQNEQPFVLEGGSVESDGMGTLLTTASCLMAPHRNQPMVEAEIEAHLKLTLGVSRVLWLRHGYLAGDDTDGHIDMLARFCTPSTIAYVAPPAWEDEHSSALRAMEAELLAFRTLDGKPYQLIPLPMATPVYHDGERLPASYANFLLLNGAVLLPVYGLDTDALAIEQVQTAFPDRQVIPINCLPIICQHGSLHCLTMQFPAGFVV